MTARRRARTEEGSALILALVFVTVIGMLIGFVLAYVETSYKYAAVTRANRGELYAADGTVERAIARVQAGGPCGDYPPPQAPPAQAAPTQINGVKVDVTCEPAPRPPPPPVEPAPSPPQAILTLGTSPVEGLHVAGTSPVGVRGDVFSHAGVEATTPLTVQGDLAAVGDCTGSITAAKLRCSNKPDKADPASAADPGYLSDLPVVPAHRVIPACPDDRWLVTFQPGYYDDAVALSGLSAGACPGRVLWFTPGVYYFDFNFSSTGSTCDSDANLCTWHIDDAAVNVVGGNPRGWDPVPGPLSERPIIDLPGGCRNDDDGVQLVFGGQSRVAQTAGKVDLCPRPGRALPPITLYGLKGGVANAATVTQRTTTASSGNPGFLTPDNARDVDERPARRTSDAALSALPPPPPLVPPPPPPGPPPSLMLAGFSGVPDGSRVGSVTLRVAHRETGEVGGLKATVTAAGSPVAGSPFTVTPCPDPTSTAYCEQVLNLGRLPAEKLPKISVTYEASPAAAPLLITDPPKVGTESLDGIVLDVGYTAPTLEKLDGCLTGPYDPASPGSCAVLKTSGAQSGLAIGGTVYAPTAAVDLNLAGVKASVLNRGIITASLRLTVAADPAYLGPVVALPDVHPKRAILSLRQSGEGIAQTTGSGRTLVRGDVFSQTDVANQSTAPLTVQGTVAAVGACTGVIEVQVPPAPQGASTPPPKRCQNVGSAPPRAAGADPVYPAAVDVVPARQAVPATCKPVVALKPGYYDDAVALSQLTNGGCPGAVIWLKPGPYYFDFNFAGTGPTCDADPTLCTWTISDPNVNVVGGTVPKKADGSAVWDETSTQRPHVDIPGGCRASGDPNDIPGVQLIFGGQSRVAQTAGNVELCPFRESHLAPAIPLYGLARGEAHEQARSFPATTTDANVGFANPANAHRINEEPTRLTADVTAAALAAGSISLRGFAPTVPEGSRFASASLRIAHRETALTGVQTVTVVGSDGTPLTATPIQACASFCEERIPLPGITSLAQLTGIRATYQVTLSGLGPVTENLDGIELEVRSTPPSFEALSGCLVAEGGCALVKTSGAATKLVLNGTVYTPTTALDLDLTGVSSPIVNDGVIAGSTRLTIHPSACYSGPAISHLDAQFPSDPPEAGVVFTACIRGTPVLRARVIFGPPAAARVESWSVLH